MNRLPRHPKTQTTKRNPNPDNQQIEDRQGNLPPRRKVPAPIHEQPEDPAESEGEPAGEKGSLQTMLARPI